MNLYREPNEAAKNINILLEYLLNTEKGKKYIYRGQTKNWPGPLMPSIYRRSIQGEKLFDNKSDEYKHRFRGFGNIFHEMQPDSFILWIIKNYGDNTLFEDEWTIIEEMTNNYEISKKIAREGYESIFNNLKPYFNKFKKFPTTERLWLWKRLIDERQRAKIREDGFLQAFGYVFGMTTAQQYGFASEFLDFTSNVKVSAFFATYDSPKYIKHIANNNTKDNLGVIFRLPADESKIIHNRIDSFNYYSAPGQINLFDVCIRFEDNSSPELSNQSYQELDYYSKLAMNSGHPVITPWTNEIDDLMQNHKNLNFKERTHKYLELYFFLGGKRFYQLLNMPNGAYDNSRIGRQSSVMIVPDELRIQEYNNYGEITKVNFQALEDISTRHGFETFYFKHTDIKPNIGNITREYLWPKDDDLYKELVLQLISPESPPWDFRGNIIPKRKDLLDIGYTN